jgi:hypothetical protein
MTVTCARAASSIAHFVIRRFSHDARCDLAQRAARRGGRREVSFIVGGSIVLELKAIERLAPVHTRQLQTYLRLSGCPLGFVINFGALRILDDIVRQVNNFLHGTTPHAEVVDRDG